MSGEEPTRPVPASKPDPKVRPREDRPQAPKPEPYIRGAAPVPPGRVPNCS